MNLRNFFNTTKESVELKSKYIKKATNQDSMIYSIFLNLPDRKLSASVLENHMDCPITSIRRSLNTLERLGKITRCEEKAIGKYGRPEYKYKLVEYKS